MLTGTQLEEPFTVLPMQAFCDKIYNWCMEIVSWSPGDNGREMKPIKPEHSYFTGSEANGYYNGVNGYSPEDYYYVEPEQYQQQEYSTQYQSEPTIEQLEATNVAALEDLKPPEFSTTKEDESKSYGSSGSVSMEEFLRSQGK